MYFDELETVESGADESVEPGTGPEETVRMLAFRKANAVAQRCAQANVPVIGADTVVYAAGNILGKPVDRKDAVRMLRLISGGTHTVYSGVCVIYQGRTQIAVEQTQVTMRKLSGSEISRYIDTGECDDKAGAYAIQGKAGAFVEKIDGSFQNVVGLPVFTLDRLMRRICGEGLL